PQAQRGMTDRYISIIIYSIIFIGYAVMRIRKAVIKKNPEKSTIITMVCSIVTILLIAVPVIFSYGKAPERKQQQINDNKTENVTSTTVSTAEIIQKITSVSSTISIEPTETVTSSFGKDTSTSESLGTSTSISIIESGETTEESSEEISETETTPVEDEPTTDEEQSEPEQPELEPVTAPPTEPELVYIYNNGTYSGTAYGYAGDITVTITIENDIITSISATADGDDPEYYDYAMDYILPQIQQNMSADVDAYSGATYSSKGLIDAARQALSQAVR
ncbi:MAG: FMN-binding protein, partial [Ruminococcus sp.]|nr:FMN-binding protein [Ruminococcus sp.]